MPVNQFDADMSLSSFAAQRIFSGTTILCLYTGKTLPGNCAAMPLDPEPPTGWPLGEDFSTRFAAALEVNYAVHDGAIMCGRAHANQSYILSGWSFRLFPPPSRNPTAFNRGSAFHSCLAMSLVPSVDQLYLASERALLKFRGGDVETL